MKYVPWKLLQNWVCIGCGRCCYRYLIQLKDEESAIIRKLWPDAVEERRGRIYLRKAGKKCIFQSGRSCSLQPLGLKPIACKVWPFYVSEKPIRDWDDRNYQSQFLCRGKEYFVYINTTCYGVNKTTTANLRKVISEVIMLTANPQEKQHYSTSRRYSTDNSFSTDDVRSQSHEIQNIDVVEYEVELSKPDPLQITPKKV